MAAWRGFCEAVHLTALGVWLGTLIGVGAMAANIFPAVRELDPTLADYGSYTGEHWRLLGGQVAGKLFLIADIMQLFCAGISTLTLIVLLVIAPTQITMNEATCGSIGRARAVVRGLALLSALGCLAVALTAVTPRLNRELRLYWDAARIGDNAAAAAHQRAAGELHPVASGLYGGTAVCVFVSLFAGAWGAGTRREQTTLASRGESPSGVGERA